MINRRRLLLGGVAAAALGGCTRPAPQRSVAVDGPEVQAAEAAHRPGPVTEVRLEATVSEVDTAGKRLAAGTYGGQLPGTPARVNAGAQLKLTLVNRLPAETSIHWHGIALRNNADGVPHLTQPPIAAGAGAIMAYDWGINDTRFDHSRPTDHASEIAAGQRVRIDFANTTTMFHPLHGHTFATGDATGLRKDTAFVLPGQTLPAFFHADNPGQQMIHCHNVYHARPA